MFKKKIREFNTGLKNQSIEAAMKDFRFEKEMHSQHVIYLNNIV